MAVIVVQYIVSDSLFFMDIHVSNLSNGWELYKYNDNGGFCYRVRNSVDVHSKNYIDYRIHSAPFSVSSSEDAALLNSFMIHYLEDIIKDRDGCTFASTYSVDKSFWQ